MNYARFVPGTQLFAEARQTVLLRNRAYQGEAVAAAAAAAAAAATVS
jgi:hypothetical protein